MRGRPSEDPQRIAARLLRLSAAAAPRRRAETSRAAAAYERVRGVERAPKDVGLVAGERRRAAARRGVPELRRLVVRRRHDARLVRRPRDVVDACAEAKSPRRARTRACPGRARRPIRISTSWPRRRRGVVSTECPRSSRGAAATRLHGIPRRRDRHRTSKTVFDHFCSVGLLAPRPPTIFPRGVADPRRGPRATRTASTRRRPP